MVIAPENEQGMVSIMGTYGMFYANTVGAFGVVSAGGNWGRLASAVRLGALKLVGCNNDFSLLFSGDTLVLADSEIVGESSLVVIIFLMIL